MIALLSLTMVTAKAQTPSLNRPGAANKITADLVEQINAVQSPNELVNVIIVLRDQYDFQASMRQTRNFDRQQRRDFVVDELQRFSEAAQRGVLNDLNQGTRANIVSDVKPLWIANAIICSMNRDMVYAIAERPDVAYVTCDSEIHIADGETIGEMAGVLGSRDSELQWNVVKVNAPDVWSMGYTGAGIVVAVIDTGVNYNHTDIANNMWDGGSDYPNHGWDWVNDDNDPMDDHSHGTHCAGTVSSYGTNGKQCGIAKDAKIMALKTLSGSGSGYSSNTILAIQFAVAHGADVLSLSLGSAGVGGYSPYREVMENTLAAGVVASVAAGNDGERLSTYPIPYNIGSPGSCPPPWHNPDQTLEGGLSAVVTVGATTSSDTRSSFSSIGPTTWAEGSYIGSYGDYPYVANDPVFIGLIKPDVAAPGSSIVSLSYASNTGYLNMSGTSMATPCVAGVMALMLSANPAMTPPEIDQILENTAVHIQGLTTKNNYTGAGRVDALTAVASCSALPPDIHFEPNPVNLGHRPIGDWMRPVVVEISNMGGMADIQGIQVNNSNYSLDLGDLTFPFDLYYNNSVEVAVNTNSASAPATQLVVTYGSNQHATVNVSATPYTPVVGDVWELPKEVTSFPYTENINSSSKPFYDNYVLPPASLYDGPDAVYKLSFTQDVSLTASVTSGDNGKMALYAEGFEGVGGPDLNNFYHGQSDATVNVVFELTDSWGDGWNGASLVVDLGNGTVHNLTISSGSSASYVLAIPYGTHVALRWVSGSFDSECSFTVAYEGGDDIFSASNPSAGLLYEFDTPIHIEDMILPAGVYYLAASSTSNTWSVSINANPLSPGTVAGHVYEQDGTTPIANATVTVFGDDFFGDYQNASFTTNATGAYSGQMPKGTYQAVATAQGYSEAEYAGTIAVDFGSTISGIDFVLDEAFVPVAEVVAEYYPNNPSATSVKVNWSFTPSKVFSTADNAEAEAGSHSQPDRSFQYYRLYRTDAYNNGPFEGGNTVLVADNLTTTSYIDPTWGDISGIGTYKYGIGCVYAGNRGENDSRGTVTYDFEDGLIPASWTNDSEYPWVVSSPSYSGYNGTYCMMSTNSGISNSSSSISATVDYAQDGSVSFLGGCWGEGSSPVWDACEFYIDGNLMLQNGALQTWNTYSFDVTAGTHTFTWVYTKDGSVNPTGDAFFVDDVVFAYDDPLQLERESAITWSNFIDKGMWLFDGDVNVTVTISNGDSPAGVTVSLTNLDPNDQAAYPMADVVLGESGYYEWDSFRKGYYKVTVSKEGYTTVVENNVDLWEATNLAYVLDESIEAVTNLYVSRTGFATWKGLGNDAPGATVILTAGNVWGDGTGYQMLLDVDANTYGSIIPTSGALSLNCSGNEAIYAEFEYKIPEAADGQCTSSNIVFNNSVAIQIPAGTYDWCITNPTPGQRIWIAGSSGSIPGRYDDFVFEKGNTYEFVLNYYGGTDGVTLYVNGEAVTDIGKTAMASDEGHKTGPAIQTFEPVGHKVLPAQGAKGDRAFQHIVVTLKNMEDAVLYTGTTLNDYMQLPTENLVEGELYQLSVQQVYSGGNSSVANCTWIYAPCDNLLGANNLSGEENAGGVTISWTYPEINNGRTVTIAGDWYYYDDGNLSTGIGTGGGNFWWGIMIPADSYDGNMVTKVSAYDYMAMSGTVTIYNDGSDAPAGSAVGQTDVTFTGSSDFVEFEFAEPVVIDPTKNVWVVFYNESGATHPAAASANTGDANGRWVSLDGSTWSDLASYGLSYTFMVRAFIVDSAIGDPYGMAIFRDGEWVGFTNEVSFTDSEGSASNDYEVRVVYGGKKTCPYANAFMSMSCPQAVEIGVSGATQTTDFAAGWNWWSTYIDAGDVLTQLESGLVPNGQTIKSKSKSRIYRNGNWMGGLTAIEAEGSYRVQTSAACTVDITGAAATNPSAHPITLTPGWTWIGYPSTATMTVTEALANLTPTQGDVIKSKNKTAVYRNGAWMSSFAITPGTGLMYKSSATTNLTLVYPSSDAKGEAAVEEADNLHWTPNASAYPSNMTVIAVVELDGAELVTETTEGYELAAFADGECRGSFRLIPVEGRCMAILTVAGDEAAGLRFALYDAATGEEWHDATQSLDYETDAVVGDIDAPYVVRFRSAGVDEWENAVNVYPNPVGRGQKVSLGLNAGTTGKVQVEIVNALGIVVETRRAATAQTEITAPSVAGVYTLRITVEGKGTCHRKLVVR